MDSEDKIVKLVDKCIEDNLSSRISLKDIAKLTSKSVRSISRHYKYITGLSIGEKLNKAKMYKAEELLRETDLQIKAVAYQVGFDDIRYFSRRFKTFFKCSASDYRKNIIFPNKKRLIEEHKIGV